MNRILRGVIRRWRRIVPVPRHAVRTMCGGYRMQLRPASDLHERALYQAGTYEAGTLALMDAVLRRGDVAIDVGANLGLMTLHAAQLVGPTGLVVAIEPHPLMFDRLCQNITLNRFENVRPVRLAAGASATRRPIYDLPSVSIGRASLIEPTSEHVTAAVVDVQPLDDIAGALPSVRFLKIDVEGFEAEVLAGAGAILSKGPIICMEVSAALDAPGDPLAAHDHIMATERYHAFHFLHTKEQPGPLVAAHKRHALAMQRYDNIVYVPTNAIDSLPAHLFATPHATF